MSYKKKTPRRHRAASKAMEFTVSDSLVKIPLAALDPDVREFVTDGSRFNGITPGQYICRVLGVAGA